MEHTDTLQAIPSPRMSVTRYNYEKAGSRFSIVETSGRLWILTPKGTAWVQKEDQAALWAKLFQYEWTLTGIENVPSGTLSFGDDAPRLHSTTFRTFFHPSSIPPSPKLEKGLFPG